MIKKSIYSLMLLQLFFLQTFTQIKATNLKLIMYNHTALQGSQVVVPVRVADFNSILSIQGSIQFDNSIVSYSSTEQYGLTGMSASNFGITQAGSGKITFSWFDASMSGQTLGDSSIIFAIKFNVIGNNGQQTALSFIGSPTALEFVNSSLTTIPYTLINGSVSVSNSSSGILKIMADNVTSVQGSQVVVPVRVSDFNNVLSMQGSIDFSTSVATFISFEQLNLPGFSLANFGTSQAGSGILTFSWFDQTLAGQSVSDSSVIFAIRFQLVGSAGSQTQVTFTDLPTNIEFTDNFYATLPYATSSGSITVSNTTSGGLVLFPDSVFTPTLTQVQLPVKTTGFSDMVSIQGTIEFDPLIATYSGISQFGLPGMDINNFGTSQTANGKLTFSWLDATLTGQSLADSASIFTIVFDVIGSPGEHTIVNLSNDPTALEFVDISLTPISAQIDTGGIYIELPYSISIDSISDSSMCTGASFDIFYSTPNNYNLGNIFTAQLSDEFGDFTNPIEIGTLSNTLSGIINAVLPNIINSGYAYQIRIVSSNPSVIGNNFSSNITILQYPSKPGIPTGQSTLCQNVGSVDYTVSGSINASDYVWNIEPVNAGIITASATNATVNWSNDYTGSAKIYVKAVNSECISENSDSLFVLINSVHSIDTTLIFCEGESYVFGTQTLINSGNYTEIFTSVNGCDSIVNLEIIFNPVYTTNIDSSICSGQIVVLGSQTLTFTGAYTENFYSISGCDSIVTLNLTVNPSYSTTDEVEVCNGETYSFGTQTLASTGVYFETFTSSLGCDSLVTLAFTVNPNYATQSEVVVCEGDSYIFGSQTLIVSGSYSETFLSVNGCDSVVNLTFIVNPVYNETAQLEICEGDSYNFGSQLLTATGVYSETFSSINSCDSIVTLTLTVNPVYSTSQNVSICDNESYVLGSQTLNTNGIYSETFQTISGCDSVVTVTLTVNPTYWTLSEVEVCNGNSYTLPDGTIVSSSGTYTNVFISEYGCDSTIVTNLTVNQTYNYTDDIQICNGNSYQLPDGTTANTDGTYTSNLLSEFGCDSIIITNLSLVNEIVNNIDIAICEGGSYFAQGEWQTLAGTYYDTTSSVLGCDSIIVSQLSVINNQYSGYSASICEGDSYLFDSQLLSTSGTYFDTLLSSLGCDSIVELQLTVINIQYSSFNASICEGDSYLFDSQVLTASGTYSDTLISSLGCDSVVSLNLIVNQSFLMNNNIEVCDGDSAFLNGAWQTQEGYFYDSLQTITGCDSIIVTHFYFEIFDCFLSNIEICEGDSIMIGGNYQSLEGIYFENVTSGLGCTYECPVQLIVNPIQYNYFSLSICEGDSYVFGSQLLSTSGTYYDTLLSSLGCDSIVELQLSVISNQYSTYSDSICFGETYVFGSQLISNTGTYFDTLQSSLGCDSIITLNLTVNQEIIVDLGSDYSVATNNAGSITLNAGNSGMSFLWNDGSTNQILVYNYTQGFMDSLIFYVTVSDGNCFRTDSIIIEFEVIPFVSFVSEIPLISIYPNPATNEVFIETSNFKPLTRTLRGVEVSNFKLYSIEGKKVLEGKLESPKNRISTKDLESGVYFIEVENSNIKSQTKLIITK